MATKSFNRVQKNRRFTNYVRYTGYEDPTPFENQPDHQYWSVRAMMLEIDVRKLLGRIITDRIINQLERSAYVQAHALAKILDALKGADDPVVAYVHLTSPAIDYGDLDDGPVDATPLGGW